jgi:hypothetical protein
VHRRGDGGLLLALLLSVLAHALVLLVLPVPQEQATAAVDLPIEVALAPRELPEPERPRQMVAPPDEINDRAPDRARFESDRDNTVLQETVAPGVPNPAPPVPAPKAAAPKPPRAPARDAQDGEDDAAAQKQRAHAPALGDLFASTDELVRAEQSARERAEREAADEQRSARRRVAIAVAPVAPEWALPGQRGTYDYLPDIQRGNVTLLNTKANSFAPFVRRVGERVFQHLILRQRTLELQQILSAHAPVRMRVLLDAKGKLKTVRVEDNSGSASMDDTLSEALATAAFDNNPPPAAANGDGDYEFVFVAQLRTFTPGDRGLPGRIESRLSVGLL